MKRWETAARLDLGDHGMGARRDDPQRVGLVELTDGLRWVPREGADWTVPLSQVTVRTRRRLLGPRQGVELGIPGLGIARVRSSRDRRLLRELLRRGAAYDPRD